MNLFNDINKSYMTGMMLPAATVLTFSALILTLGYMDRILNKKLDIDFRIAKVKARFNAESGVAITISGPTENGSFVPSIGSSAWPPNSDEDVDLYESNIIDSETFAGYHKPENITSFFPNAGIPNTTNIEMGEFYNITLKAYGNEVTRRLERSGSAYGRAKVEGFWGDDVYLIDSAEVKYTVEVLSDFMYLTHHELAGGAPGIYGRNNNPNSRRQPCFGPDDGLGSDEQSLVGFTQTLDPMLICNAWNGLEFSNLVYITRATNNQFTDPPNWVTTEYNTTFLSVGDSIMPDWSGCGGCDYDDIFFSNEGPAIHPEYEVRDPICFPLEGYKETVLSAVDIYDSREMLRLSNDVGQKDTLIMTDIEFLEDGGYTITRWWYLMPPYLRSDILNPTGGTQDINIDSNQDGLPDYLYSMPYHLEGMPSVTYAGGGNPTATPTTAQLNAINAICDGDAIGNNLIGNLTECEPYEQSMHDFSSLLIDDHGDHIVNAMYNMNPYQEYFNTDYSGFGNELDDGPGGGSTRLSHYDVENFTDYFGERWSDATAWLMDIPYGDGGNRIQQSTIPPRDGGVIIYVKGGPVRVHGAYKGTYTVVTSGYDNTGGLNGLDAGQAGYDGWSTYRRHAWPTGNPQFGAIPIDTIRANIWVTDDLTNADALGNGGPPQPDVYAPNNIDIICDFDYPGACGGSENIMGLVSSANVIIANSTGNRNNGINLHASVVALNESFVMHYWQHSRNTGCAGAEPYEFDSFNALGDCSQTPPHADNRGRDIYGNNEPDTGGNGRGYLRLWGGIIQKHRGYMMRNNPGPYITANIGMDKQYMFDNNLYFPPPGAIKITECESNTVRMSMLDYGMIRP